MLKKDKSTFVIKKVKPGLPGLTDGSLSALAPIFATASLSGQSIMRFMEAMGHTWTLEQ